MKILLRFFLLCLILASGSTRAQEILNQDAKKILKQAALHLSSVAVDFTQTNQDGTRVAGKLLVQKPYNFRCNYYTPHPLLMIGDKRRVVMYDYEMDELAAARKGDNILNFLLTDDFRSINKFSIKWARIENGLARIMLRVKNTSSFAEVGVHLDKSQIKHIKIVEGFDVISIEFSSLHTVLNFDDRLFQTSSSKIFGIPSRLNEAEIEKYYVVKND